MVANGDAYVHSYSLADGNRIAYANWNSDGGAIRLDRRSDTGREPLDHVKVFVLPTLDTHSARRFQASWSDPGHFSSYTGRTTLRGAAAKKWMAILCPFGAGPMGDKRNLHR